MTKIEAAALEWFMEAVRTENYAAFRADPRNLAAFTRLAPNRPRWKNITGRALRSVRDWLAGPFAAPMQATIEEAREALTHDR